MEKIAIFAGSFDPLHDGHISIIKQSLMIFSKIIILVANSDEKKNHHSLEKRYQKVKASITLPNTYIDKLTTGYVADYARNKNIKFLVRSARDCDDFKYELLINKTNQILNNKLSTILIMPNQKMINLRSSKIKNNNQK